MAHLTASPAPSSSAMAHLTNDNASPASSSSASTSSYAHYDVFINHRGPDVKNTFASYLYRRLLDHRLRVFLDKPELETGHNILSQIEAAIQAASVHIAIFSPTYAESKWCLDELVLMLNSTATILPVFYKVKPSDLRWTLKDGAYADALRKHQQKTTSDPQTSEGKPRYDPNTIQNWRDALSLVADISGFELEANCNEPELLDKVVQRVLKIVPKAQRVLKIVPKAPPFVVKHPTGLDDKLQDFERSVLSSEKQESVKARVVGIVGGGGIGKTTLAKEFFNRRSSYYNGSSFLFDVREAAASMSLINLQMKLIKDLTPRADVKIDSPEEGISVLKQHLLYCHALVILDDVDKADQLEVLLPIKDVLSSNSLILVTSRDKQILVSSGIVDSSIYKLAGMNRAHSQDLFCSYAFYQPHPLPGFTDLVELFVTACDGLPLSLKVIGALLCGRNERSYWQERLNELKILPPDDILQRLKISYHSLNQMEQKIFLDIACFFIGEQMGSAIRIWGQVPVLGIEDKCLFEVGSVNEIKMHDHVRDMGRCIAQESSMPRRLWRPLTNNSIDTLFEQPMSGITEVRGILTVHRHPWYSSDRSKMSRYKRWSDELLGNRKWSLFNKDSYYDGRSFQILASEDGYIKAILRRVRSPHLIWLRWYKCPFSSLPSWLPMEHLRVLEVAGKRLNMLWQHESQAPLQLRELNICTPLSHVPKSIGQLKHLEKIEIVAARLKTLPEEFFDLRSLKYLDLTYATDLEKLPDSFGKLTNLQHINLKGALRLKVLPNSFGNLTRLKYLSLRRCSDVTISNETLGNISALEYLDLSGCCEVKELPPQLAHQRSLEKLYLRYSGLKELPSGIGNLCNLEVLEIGGRVLKNSLLKVLPLSFGYLKSLKDLSVVSCPELKCLPDTFVLLTRLTNLSLTDCGIHYLPQGLLQMNNLEILRVEGCPLVELPFKKAEGERETRVALNDLDSASNNKYMFGLVKLRLFRVAIRELTFSEGVCPNLQALELYDCKQLRQIGRLCGLEKLQHFKIHLCNAVEELPSLETLTSLEEMDVQCCSELKRIQGLGQLTKLQKLIFRDCPKIEELPDLEHLISLEVLNADRCHKLKRIEGLGQLTKLRTLNVCECYEIKELPDLEHLIPLEVLNADRCHKLKSIEGLGQLTKLRTLTVRECYEIEKLPDLEHLISLEVLNADGCHKLKSIEGLGQLAKLRRLNVCKCYEIEELPGLEHLMVLEELSVGNCRKLKSLPGLGHLTNLQTLLLEGCHQIQAVPGVEHLMSLKQLNVRDCPKLQWGEGVVGQLRRRMEKGFEYDKQNPGSGMPWIRGLRLG